LLDRVFSTFFAFCRAEATSIQKFEIWDDILHRLLLTGFWIKYEIEYMADSQPIARLHSVPNIFLRFYAQKQLLL